jgi:hypothetical protein
VRAGDAEEIYDLRPDLRTDLEVNLEANPV